MITEKGVSIMSNAKKKPKQQTSPKTSPKKSVLASPQVIIPIAVILCCIIALAVFLPVLPTKIRIQMSAIPEKVPMSWILP